MVGNGRGGFFLLFFVVLFDWRSFFLWVSPVGELLIFLQQKISNQQNAAPYTLPCGFPHIVNPISILVFPSINTNSFVVGSSRCASLLISTQFAFPGELPLECSQYSAMWMGKIAKRKSVRFALLMCVSSSHARTRLLFAEHCETGG